MTPIKDILKKSIPTPKPSSIRELTKIQMELGVIVPSAEGSYRNAECLTCRDIGWVLGKPDERNRACAIPCPDCKRAWEGEDKTDRMLRLSGIPDARREYNFVSFLSLAGAREAIDASEELARGETDKKWLLIYGGVGSGKPHLAIAIGIELVKRGIVVKFIKTADLLSELKRAMGDSEISCDELLEYYKQVECLILDDLKLAHQTPWAVAKLEEIIASRWEAKKYVIATMDKDINELTDRIRSRFLDTELSVVVRNLAPDYRRKRERPSSKGKGDNTGG